jgi:hypothetical protein
VRLHRRRQDRRGGAGVRGLDAAMEDSAPEASLINLVDLMLVFAVGLMLALSVRTGQLASNSSQPDAANRLNAPQRMKTTGQPQAGSGTRIGSAYRLANGEIVYVPESSSPAESAPPTPAK